MNTFYSRKVEVLLDTPPRSCTYTDLTALRRAKIQRGKEASLKPRSSVLKNPATPIVKRIADTPEPLLVTQQRTTRSAPPDTTSTQASKEMVCSEDENEDHGSLLAKVASLSLKDKVLAIMLYVIKRSPEWQWEASLESLATSNRTRRFARPRHMAMYLLTACKFSGPQIGVWLGKRDHTTVLHGIRVMRLLIKEGDVATLTCIDKVKKLSTLAGIEQLRNL